MKRIIFLTITALLALNAFGQMAGGVSKKYRSSNKSTQEYCRGYKGFIEIGGSAGATHNHVKGHEESFTGYYGYDYEEYDYTNKWLTGTGGLYTTHGYQFNSYLFLGAGIGAEYSGSSNKLILPLYGEFRCNFQNPNTHKCIPFIGVRAGANVFKKSHNGFFGNIFLGYRIPLQGAFALNVSVGYQLHKYNYSRNYSNSYWDSFYEITEWHSDAWTEYYSDHTCSIRLGIEF